MVFITEIVDRRIGKRFLGGYRNRITSVEYFNAASQTGPVRKCPEEWKEQKWRARDVQCVELKESSCQSNCNRTTQTLRKDYYVRNITDCYLTAKPYETHEEMVKRLNLNENARIIQRSYRAYRLLKYIAASSKAYKKIVEDCKKFEQEKVKALRKRHENEIRRQTYPRSRADFDKLYNLIETWRVSRLDLINNKMFAASRRAENDRILERTSEMLRALEKHRRCIADDRREINRTRFLTENCEPIAWNGYKAKPIEIITPKIQRARIYKSVYDDLMKKDTRLENRIQLLIQLKNSLKSHSCCLVENLVDLLNQEIDLLSHGVKNLWFNGLRDRISTAYLQFVCEASTCTCAPTDPNDPSIADYALTERRSKTKKLLCRSCMKMLPYRNFSAHVRMKKLSCCLGCTRLRQRNIDKTHYGPYTFMLNGIRADEQKRNCYSSLLFVIREPGIYHLVNNIWHSHSVLSENDDLFNLRLVRWNIDEEWSPWNCILLTSDEAETHYFVKDFTSFYSKRLLRKIYLAHLTAKTHFKELINFEKNFRVSSRYYMIQDRKDYDHSKFES